MSQLTLNSVSVPVINIINKNLPENGQINLELRRSYKKEHNQYIGNCAAQLYFKDDDEREKNFFIEIEVCGIYFSNSDNISEETLKDYIMNTLLPHLNAVLSSTMAIAFIPPQLIPTSLLADFYPYEA